VDMAFSPRVVGKSRPDFHSLQSMLRAPQFAGKQGEELVMAIYNYFTSQVDGTYHFWPSGENEGQPRIRRTCTDPIKILNAYGWAICGQMSHMLYTIYTAAGLKARLYGLPGHALCEVFYDGRWHHFDVDMWSWFRTPAGHVASAFELSNDARALILDNKNKSSPCNLPDRDLEGYADMYSRAEKDDKDITSVRPDWADRSHCMDFHLRLGETILRTSENQGRFVMPLSWIESMDKFAREWHGVPRERYEPFRTFGNGRWIYEPNLSEKSKDFAAGVWEKKGIRQRGYGLSGDGYATFRIQCPYPFAGIPDITKANLPAGNGAWVDVAGEGPVCVDVTTPEGGWQTVYTCDKPFEERVDITDILKARYECFVRVTLGQKAKLHKFRFEGFFMVAPISLPRLAEGANPMELRGGDKHGQHTVPWTQIVDFRKGADPKAQWVRATNYTFKPWAEGWTSIAAADESKPVTAIYKFAAPKGRKFGWAYFLTAHREGPQGQPSRRAMLEWSVNGKDWTTLADCSLSNHATQWDCSVDGDVLTPQGAAAIWLRVTSQTAICNVECHGHLRVEDVAEAPLQITHSWKESGEIREFKVPAGATNYTVVCGPQPRDHAIRMSMPSSQKP
jgi:hypothetical protein